MFTGIILGLGIAAGIYYVHKVGLPAIKQELKQARIEVVAAINRHATTQAIPLARPNVVRPNPIPANAVSVSAHSQAPMDMGDLPRSQES